MINVIRPGGPASLIMYVDGLLDPSLCTSIVDALEPAYDSICYPGKTGGGVLPLTKNSRDCVLTETTFASAGLPWTSHLADSEATVSRALTRVISMYCAENVDLHAWDSIEDTGYQVQRYDEARGFYRRHVDSLPGHPSSDRVAAVLVYLNTVGHGGETVFPLHGVSVTPVAGRILIFPATWTHPHEARPPIVGDKWIISTFLLNTAHTHESHPHPH